MSCGCPTPKIQQPAFPNIPQKPHQIRHASPPPPPPPPPRRRRLHEADGVRGARDLRLPPGHPPEGGRLLHPRQLHQRLHGDLQHHLHLRVLHPGLLLAPLPALHHRPHRRRPPQQPRGRSRQGPLLLAQHRRGHSPRRPAQLLRRHRLRRLRHRQLPRVPHLRMRLRLRRQPPAAAERPRRVEPAPARHVNKLDRRLKMFLESYV